MAQGVLEMGSGKCNKWVRGQVSALMEK